MGDPLTDPEHTRREYASEEGLLARRSIYQEASGVNPNDVIVELAASWRPGAVLEIGCGPGHLAERLQAQLGMTITALDSSERMVELTRDRGVDARIGDIQALAFDDDRFDLVIAAWMLYHVPDLDRGLSEVSRVLSGGGRFVAVTNGERHLEELWDLIGLDGYDLCFNAENGLELLGRHFDRVERRDVEGTVTFSDVETVRHYVGATMKARYLAGAVPPLREPLHVTRRNAIFIAAN